MLSRSLTEARWSSRACRITLYSSPPIRKVVTMREPSMVSSVRPHGAARRRGRRPCCGRSHAQLRLALVVVDLEVEEAGILLRDLHACLSRHCDELGVVRPAEHDLHGLAAAARPPGARGTTRTPGCPACAARRRCDDLRGGVVRSPQGLSGRQTMPVFTRGCAPKPPVRGITRSALPRFDLSLAMSSTCAS